MANKIHMNDFPVKTKMLWWQEQGLSQTASGYGSKLTTSKMILYAGRWRRIYAVCYSNIGDCYIIIRGKRLYLR